MIEAYIPINLKSANNVLDHSPPKAHRLCLHYKKKLRFEAFNRPPVVGTSVQVAYNDDQYDCHKGNLLG